MRLSLLRTGGNALSILSSDVMNRATSFILYALVARRLGAHEFGQLMVVLTLFYTFQVFSVGGLKTLIIRQVTKDRAQTSAYFLHGCAIVAVSSLCSVLALAGVVRVFHYPPQTTRLILLLSLGLVPYAFAAVCEAIFQAWERMRYIPYVNVPVNIAKVAAAFLLLSQRRGSYAVVLILLTSLVATALIEACIMFRRFPAQHANFHPVFAWDVARSATTFLGIDGIISVMTGLNVILLSKLATETEVGLYSAATQLMVPVLLVYQSIAQSIFPAMCQRFQMGIRGLKRITENAIELLLVLALPTVAGLYFLGDWALSVLYRNPVFSEAFPVLRIVSWTLILQVFTSVLGQVLVASHREKITLRIVAVDTLVNLCVGWPLIRHFGLRGAAIALLLTRVTDCCQHYIPASRLLCGIPLARIIWKPAVAAICMAGYLASPSARFGFLTGISAAAIYSGALLLLSIWVSGGVRQFKQKYLVLLSE
jgi:O-antigen/teichoic acid export membrane protein